MSHEITVNNGIAEAAYAIKPAWHGLGVVVDHPMSAEEAILAANLGWGVEKRSLYYAVGNSRKKFEDRVATVRSDNDVALGIVGHNYQIIQNSDAFAFMDSLIQDGSIEYEAAGSLKGGKMVWLLAKLPGEFAVTKDDISKDYLLFVNGHDGSKAVTIQPTNVRVVCSNTLSWALTAKEARRFHIRHTVKMDTRLEEARSILSGVQDYSTEVNRINKQLAGNKVDATDLTEFLSRMFPVKTVKDKDVDPEKLARTAQKVKDLFETGELIQTTATKGTAYGLLNAVTQFVDHDRGRTDEHRFISSQFGIGSGIKQEAFAVLRDMYSVK